MFKKKKWKNTFSIPSLLFTHLRGEIFNKTIYFHFLLNYFQNLKVQDFENLLIPDLMFLDSYSKFCCLKSFFGSGWAINYK